MKSSWAFKKINLCASSGTGESKNLHVKLDIMHQSISKLMSSLGVDDPVSLVSILLIDILSAKTQSFYTNYTIVNSGKGLARMGNGLP